jgi:hypothetical protein
MNDDSTVTDRIQKPFYHMINDVFRWHQFQGANSNDCGAYSVAIAANAILKQPRFEGSIVTAEMERLTWVSRPLPHPTVFKFHNWASLPWGISGYLQNKGIPARLRWLGQMEDLLRNIREGRITIVIIGDLLAHEGLKYMPWGHAKVLYGYEPPGRITLDGSSNLRPGFYFVDPGYERRQSDLSSSLQGVFWQDEAEFKVQWGNLLRIRIETGPRVTAT